MSLTELHKEIFDCIKENDADIQTAVETLDAVIKNSHTLPKWEVKKIHQSLEKSILLRNRLKTILSKFTRLMFLQHKLIGEYEDL